MSVVDIAQPGNESHLLGVGELGGQTELSGIVETLPTALVVGSLSVVLLVVAVIGAKVFAAVRRRRRRRRQNDDKREIAGLQRRDSAFLLQVVSSVAIIKYQICLLGELQHKMRHVQCSRNRVRQLKIT